MLGLSRVHEVYWLDLDRAYVCIIGGQGSLLCGLLAEPAKEPCEFSSVGAWA
jgi:hypothetical protein